MDSRGDTASPTAPSLRPTGDESPAAQRRQAWLLVSNAWALPVLATLALGVALWAGRAFLIPIFTAGLLAVLLWPWLARAQRWLRSRAVAALVVVAGIVLVTLGLAVSVVAQVSVAADKLPSALRLAARDVAALGTSHARAVQRTRSALEELDRSVARVTGTDPVSRDRPTARPASVVATLSDWMSDALLAASRSTMAVLLQAGVIALLLFLLLCNGERFARALGGWCESRALVPRQCAPVLRETARQLRMLAGVTVVSNAAIGVGVSLICLAFGVPDAAMWGLAGAALHFVPYAGLAVMAALMALETYVVQGSALVAVLAAGAVGAIGVVVGTAVPVWLQGRVAHTDGAVVFAGTVIWSVLWGAWGLVLGPLMVVLARVVFVQGRWLQQGVPQELPVAAPSVEPAPTAQAAAPPRPAEIQPAG